MNSSPPYSPSSGTSSATFLSEQLVRQPLDEEDELTVLGTIHLIDGEITRKSSSRDSKAEYMTELINQFDELDDERARLQRQILLLENGQDILHDPFGRKQELSFGGKSAPSKKRKRDAVTELTQPLNSIEEELAETTKEYEDKCVLYDQLDEEVGCADVELEALGKRVMVLVRIQEMLDARNGTKGGEDAVVVKIRRGGRYYDM